MESLKELISTENYDKILQLMGGKYNKYKTVAAIHLNRFEEALEYVEKNSFLEAYIFYKLRNFKKSLKILRKLNGKKVDILIAQNLYFLGFFNDAYKILSKHGVEDEFAVNLSAMQALNSISCKSKPSLFSLKPDLPVENVKNLKFTNLNCKMESEYNMLYQYVENEEDYLSYLNSLNEKYNIDNSIIKKQLDNLMNHTNSNFTRGEQEIVDFNTKVGAKIKKPRLFQLNFTGAKKTEYKMILQFQNANYNDFVPFSTNLWLLKAVLAVKNLPNKKRTLVLANIAPKLTGIYREIVEILSYNEFSDGFRNKATKLLEKLE
ncbi:hypothetical protein NUSPORA_02526 [Nucleospora cyclopteri]